MPQLETSTFTSQLFWLIVCFFSMMFIMSKFIIPRIADILEQRQRKIDGYLNKAADIKLQAEASLKKYQDALAKATNEANSSLSQTKEELNELIKNKQNELDSSLQKKIKEGEKEINRSKEAALKQVQSIAEGLAVDVVKKIGLTTINSQEIKAVIKEIND